MLSSTYFILDSGTRFVFNICYVYNFKAYGFLGIQFLLTQILLWNSSYNNHFDHCDDQVAYKVYAGLNYVTVKIGW